MEGSPPGRGSYKRAMEFYKPLFPAAALPEFGPGFYVVTYCDRDNNVLEFGYRS